MAFFRSEFQHALGHLRAYRSAGETSLQGRLAQIVAVGECLSGYSGKIAADFALSLGEAILEDAGNRGDSNLEGYFRGVKTGAVLIANAVRQTRSFPSESFLQAMLDNGPVLDRPAQRALEVAWENDAAALVPAGWGDPFELLDAERLASDIFGIKPCSMLDQVHIVVVPNKPSSFDVIRQAIGNADENAPLLMVCEMPARQTAGLVARAALEREGVYGLTIDRAEAAGLKYEMAMGDARRPTEAASRVVMNDDGAYLLDVPPDRFSHGRGKVLCAPFDPGDRQWKAIDPFHRSRRSMIAHGYVTDRDLDRAFASVGPEIRYLPDIERRGAQACVDLARKHQWLGDESYAPVRMIERTMHQVTDALIAGAESPTRSELAAVSFFTGGEQEQVRGAPKRTESDGDKAPETKRYLDVTVAPVMTKPDAPTLGVGGRFLLTGMIRLPNSLRFGDVSAEVSARIGVPIEIKVDVGGFQLRSPNGMSVDIPENEDSIPATFLLELTDAHNCWAALSAYQEGRFLQKVTLTNRDFLGTQERQPLANGSDVDLTLHIRTEDRMIEGFSPPDVLNMTGLRFGPLHVPSELLARDLREQLKRFQQAENDPEKIETELRVIGAQLADLVPQQLLVDLARSSPRTLLVRHAVDLDFPLELLLVVDGNEEYFLGDRVPICRWYLDVKAAERQDQKQVGHAAVLVGDTKFATSDYQVIAGKCAAEEFSSPDQAWSEVFATAKYSLLHFIGHYADGERDGPALELKEGLLRMSRIGRLPKEKKFAEATPVVMLNGCGTVVPHDAFWGKDSYAHRFVLSDASVVVGTLWPVHDTVAHEFASLFYGKLADGSSLGTALCETKREIMAATKDADGTELTDRERIRRRISARSYSVFGHPNFRIQFDASPA